MANSSVKNWIVCYWRWGLSLKSAISLAIIPRFNVVQLPSSIEIVFKQVDNILDLINPHSVVRSFTSFSIVSLNLMLSGDRFLLPNLPRNHIFLSINFLFKPIITTSLVLIFVLFDFLNNFTKTLIRMFYLISYIHSALSNWKHLISTEYYLLLSSLLLLMLLLLFLSVISSLLLISTLLLL